MTYHRKAANARTFYYTAVYETEPRSLDEADQLRECLEYAGRLREPSQGDLPPNAPVPWFTDRVIRIPGKGWEKFTDRRGASGMLSLASAGSHLFVHDFPVLGCTRSQILTVCKMLKRRHWTLHLAAKPSMTLDSLMDYFQGGNGGAEPGQPKGLGVRLWRECWRWRHVVKPVSFDHPILAICLKYWNLGCTSAGLMRRLREMGAYDIEGVKLPTNLTTWLRDHGSREPVILPWDEFEAEISLLMGGVVRKPKTLAAIAREISDSLAQEKAPPDGEALEGETVGCRLTANRAIRVPAAVAEQLAKACDSPPSDAAELDPRPE